MTKVSRTAVVPYSPTQMLVLVSDIKSYPDFIPWIRSLRIVESSKKENGWLARATAAVGFKGFSERFTTDVLVDSAKNKIDVSLVKGPFNYLTNSWRFQELGDGCEINFEIDFEFSNFLLHALMKANFDRAVMKLISVFKEEADRRYAS